MEPFSPLIVFYFLGWGREREGRLQFLINCSASLFPSDDSL